MEPLRWSWEVRVGPYVRASVAAQPWNLLAAPVVGFGLAFALARGQGVETRVGIGLALTGLVVAVWVSMLARQLRRRRRTARGQVQTYALGSDALVLAVGKDSYTLPTAELSVAAHGRDWIALRRRGMGRQPLLLFFDDPGLVSRVEAALGGAVGRERSG